MSAQPTPEALAEARIKRWALDKSVCRLFPETKGAWVKFADVEALIAAATAAERDRCAKVCDRWRENLWAYPEDVNLCLRIENEIRRGG